MENQTRLTSSSGSSRRCSPRKNTNKINAKVSKRSYFFCRGSDTSTRFRPTAEKDTSPRVRSRSRVRSSATLCVCVRLAVSACLTDWLSMPEHTPATAATTRRPGTRCSTVQYTRPDAPPLWLQSQRKRSVDAHKAPSLNECVPPPNDLRFPLRALIYRQCSRADGSLKLRTLRSGGHGLAKPQKRAGGTVETRLARHLG